MSWIRQRAKDVENRADANFSSCRADMFHCWMVGRSKHETEANFLDTQCNLFGAEVDARVQGFQHICAATATGSGTIAMLCHASTCCGGEDSGSRGNIKCSGSVSACTTGIHSLRSDLLVQVNLHGFSAHHGSHTSNLFNCFTTRTQAQCRQERAHLCRSRGACHNLFHHCRGLTFAKCSPGRNMGNCFTNHVLLLSQGSYVAGLFPRESELTRDGTVPLRRGGYGAADP